MTTAALTHNAKSLPLRRHDTSMLAIACIASLLFVIISATASVPTYRINAILLIPAAWAPYLLRRRLHLHAVHYALLIVAMLLHDLGAFGWYQKSPLPISWDILVHYYFAVPVTLIIYRAIARNYAAVLRPRQAGAAALLFMMGLGALHEIMEYLSYLLLGEEKGMLKPSTSYFLDTQRDLTNNLLGTLTAIVLLIVVRYARRDRDAR